MSIPKKIHYCWLSDDEMPMETRQCMDTWKNIMPDYEIVRWDKTKFDITSVPFVEEAFKAKKWAFASDYIRMFAIYTEGGIYLDTDVIVLKRFDEFLENGFFSSMEFHKTEAKKEKAYELLNKDGSLKSATHRIFTRAIGIQAAVLGGTKGHSYAKSCMDWYVDKHFIHPDGSYFDQILSPAIYADVALDFGFRYKDELQRLQEELVIYPSEVFAGNKASALFTSYAIHCCFGSWRDPSEETLPTESLANRVRRKIHSFLNRL